MKYSKELEKQRLLDEVRNIGDVDREATKKYEEYVISTIDDYIKEGKNIIPLTRSLLVTDELKSGL